MWRMWCTVRERCAASSITKDVNGAFMLAYVHIVHISERASMPMPKHQQKPNTAQMNTHDM